MEKEKIKKKIYRIQKSTKTDRIRKVPINNTAMYYLKKHYELTEYGKMNDFVVATKSGGNSNIANIQFSIKSILKYADTKIRSSNTHIIIDTAGYELNQSETYYSTVKNAINRSYCEMPVSCENCWRRCTRSCLLRRKGRSEDVK